MLSASDISSAAYQAHLARKARLRRKRVLEPVASYPPSVSVAGGVATANAGAWTGGPDFTYQWLEGGSAIVDETAATYEIQEGDELIAVIVTATNSGGARSATSPAVEV